MKNLRKLRFLIILCLLLAVPASSGSALSGYFLSKYENYQVRYELDIMNDGGPAKNVKVEIPLLMTNNLPPYQTLRSFTAFPGVKGIRFSQTEFDYTAELNLASLPARGRYQVEFLYNIYNAAIEYDLDRSAGWDPGDPRFLKAESGVESEDPAIRSVAEQLVNGCSTGLEKAKKIFAYVNTSFKYQRLSGTTHSALQTLRAGRGVCSDFSMLYTALCRASGIPARVVRGWRFEAREITERETDLDQYAHAWTEIELPGLGWIPVDPTSYTYQNGNQVVSYSHFAKISDSDRHLFANYRLDESQYQSTFEYDPRVPARIKINLRKLIKKI